MFNWYLGRATMASSWYMATLVAITFFDIYRPLLLNMFFVVGHGHSKLPPVHFTVSGKIPFALFVNAGTTTAMTIANIKTDFAYIVLLVKSLWIKSRPTEQSLILRQLYTRWHDQLVAKCRKSYLVFWRNVWLFRILPLASLLTFQTRNIRERSNFFRIFYNCNCDITAERYTELWRNVDPFCYHKRLHYIYL